MRIEVGGDQYEFDGWRVFRLYALLALLVAMSIGLYLRTTGGTDSVFTSVPAMLVYVLMAWALLMSKDRPSFLDGE